MKCNFDGVFVLDSSSAACGGLFRDSEGNFIYAFAISVRWMSSTLEEF